jgi:type 1 glutamine amidotransferase
MQLNAEKLKVLLVSGLVVKEHDYTKMNQNIKAMLESTGRFAVKITEDFTGSTSETLKRYDLVFLNYDGMEWINDDKHVYWGEKTEEALYLFVKSGKGIVFYHSSFASGKGTPEEYIKMAGATMDMDKGGRRSPKSDFIITTSDESHPITRGLPKQWMTVGDDFMCGLSILKDSKITPLAYVFDSIDDYRGSNFPPPHMKDVIVPDGDLGKMHAVNMDQPVAWANEYGEGRVFVITIGHDIDTMRRVPFLTMLVRGAEWAATGVVTLDPPDRTGENRLKGWPYY